MKEFFVIRLCNKADGTAACPVSSHDTEESAWKEFYRLCGQAVDSTHLTDTVIIITKSGFTLDHKCFEHDAPVVEEMPEE